MDGRFKRWLVSAFLLGAVGCSSTGTKKPSLPSSTAEPPLNSASHKPPVDKGNDGPVKVETLLAFANAHVEAATLPDRSEVDREICMKAARDKYNEVLKRDPKNMDAMLGMAHTHKILEQKAQCLEWYGKAMKLYPKNAAIVAELGQTLDALKDREAAIEAYHKATKMDPSSKTYRKALGFALARAGRYDEAFAWLNRCMTPIDAHLCLGQMMDHNGHRNLADAQYAEVLKLDPVNRTARLALNDTGMPSDGIPVATPIETVGYQSNITSPMGVSTAGFSTPAAYMNAGAGPSSLAAEPMPMPMNQPIPSSPVQNWMQR